MIELIPAIDIIDGKCVRLTKGDYEQKTVYRDSPADVAQEFEQLGFKRLHVVDLDGAKSKHIVNDQVLREITQRTSLVVDFGGGIKTDEDIEKAFDAGASMVTVGSIAVTRPDLFGQWLQKYGAERMILGADVRNGKISINGWKEDSTEDLLPFLKKYIDQGVRTVLCTEISKDGTLQGPAIHLYKEVMTAYPTLHLIASGGVSSKEDIEALDHAGIPAVVFGKAIYEGRIDLRELIATDEQGETRNSDSIRVNPMPKIATDEQGETRNSDSIRVNPMPKIATDEQGETRKSESIRVNPMQKNSHR